MIHTHKIGDKVVFINSINDSLVRTIDEIPSVDGRYVTLDGYKHTYDINFLRPATAQECQLRHRV